ncbi:MAG: Mov34/MPN/PAD-1 family protein, partial [Candidatus Omnitrophica bacterium]|nr:Mov34/MPN/PAD-1 family protein [Candidatus Omnitrophota bacterium]
AAESFELCFPCRNLQNEMHEKNPKQFPRTSQTAYFLDPQDLFRIQKMARERGMEMKVIYHSHADVGAYFSEEDKRQALCEGKPLYPNVSYLVVDAIKDKNRGAKLFGWEENKKDFVELEFHP